MSLPRPGLRCLSVLLLFLSLFWGGCGWFSRSKAIPPGPTLSTSEAARDAEPKRRPTPTPPQPVAAPAPAPLPRRDAPDVLDRVIAVVNNDVITLSELQDSLAFYLSGTREAVKPGEEEALKQRLLNRMIENRLQLQEASREQLTVEDAEVDEQLAEVRKQVNARTQEEFEQIVKAQGVTLEGIRKRARDQVLIQKVIRRKVAFRITVTEHEIEQYLVENREKLETGLSYHARHILFAATPPGSEAALDAARGRAEEVWAKVRAGEDFVELAKRHSEDSTAKDGGDLGVLKQGELAPEVERQILRLRPGEASAPFRSPLGFHIFKLEWKEGLAGETLAQAKQQIRDILIRQKYATRLEAWLAEIRKRAIIDIRL
ncbi:MAG: PpiC-type peptidylprolyl cis-trans isomerase, peptidyl-prolyl cis-trans isomerase SurA [Candidatus Rokubacteria bacterium CSP1-6]|nr:MAG: PpiC-type peptidylprolyl cis-trans isomerase, peptidyl-prolyl cis-trans isomerase SurA [Candidatus Rokubacteria bacterium CSP1-6]